MSPPTSRATRGAQGYRHQPSLRFSLKVPTRFGDGNALTRGERVGTKEQGYLGPVIQDKIPYLTTTSRADLLSAFNKRANYHSNDRVDPFVRSNSIRLIKALVPVPMPVIEWDPELYRNWLGMFDSEKRARMERAYHLTGLDRLSDYSNKQIFTKIEALIKDPETVAPRVIFQGSDFYNMISGPIFKVLMERFVLTENQLKEVKFKVAYKQDTTELAGFMESVACKSYIEADFSSNDKTQVRDVIELESMFMARLGAPKWFVRLHKATNKFSVYNTKYGVSAVIENQMPSGCTDGTFRNTFWNLCIFYSWCRKTHTAGAVVMILGDDMVGGLPTRVRRAARNYRSVATLARMVAKVTTSPTLAKTHFLSKHFIPVTRGELGHVMLPFIGKVLAKFNARPNSNQAVSDDEYMAGKALSHCYEFRHCHVIRDLFVRRANIHLMASDGRYSLEGVTYHVRIHAAYPGEIEALLDGSTHYADLVTSEDLCGFWLDIADLAFSDVFPLAEMVITDPKFVILDHLPLNSLTDY